uniref:Uncharacterized protein n=1 Tax=Brassica campestris TaxID=3711 RepID=M4DGB6_BRACM
MDDGPVEAKARGTRSWRLQKEIHESYGVEKQEMEDRPTKLPAAKNCGSCVCRLARVLRFFFIGHGMDNNH